MIHLVARKHFPVLLKSGNDNYCSIQSVAASKPKDLHVFYHFHVNVLVTAQNYGILKI